MLKKLVYLLIIVFILTGSASAQEAGGQAIQADADKIAIHSKLKTTAELLANILITGRNILAEAQIEYRINDYRVGDKGFTPAIFVSSINKDFKQQTGIDILKGDRGQSGAQDQDLKYLKILLDASAKVCADNQLIINTRGIGFKGFIPATYGRAVADIFREKTGIILKQTSIKFRNSYNVPDDTEEKVLEEMAKPDYPKGKAWFADEVDRVRLMKPLYIKRACLNCHGSPKGVLDVAGRKKEGYQLGELRGAITVLMKK